jgi:hypothetical protein
VALSGEWRAPALKRGEAVRHTARARVPSGTATGLWFVVVCADATRAVREAKESNNCRASAKRTTVKSVVRPPPANHAPTELALAGASVSENQPAGTTVGTLSTNDPDAGDSFNYSLVAGAGSADNASFTIGGSTVKTNAAFDFETKSSYSIRVRTTDSGALSFEKAFTISVGNLNEAPNNIIFAAASVPENQPLGTNVGFFSSSDPDAGDTASFSLVAGAGSTDNAAFTISGDTLKTNAVFDFETKSSYSIRVLATDSGSPGLTSEEQFTVSVGDVNEAPTNIALSNSSVMEGQPMATSVGDFSTIDPDAGDSFSYTLVAGAGSDDNGSFTISGNTLKTDAVFDLATKSSYSIRVRTSDSGSLSFEKTFTISVTKLNHAPTEITLSSASVAENEASGTSVGMFAAVDSDAGDSAGFDLVAGAGSADNGSFTITGNTLQTNAVFDFETKASYSIRVRATDSGSLTFEKQFTINVTDVNEAPTDLALSNSSVAENELAGTTVGSLSASDPDAGDSPSFSLIAGAGSADNGSFTITGNTLQTNAAFDFEAKASFSIRVRATDGGALTFEKAFTISVTDVNEAPTEITLSNESIAENEAADTAIGTLTASDQDSGQSHGFSLENTGCGGGPFPANTAFTIAGGSLRSGVSFNYEVRSSYLICVRVTDSGSPALSFDKQFTINVTNVNEAPTDIALSSSSVPEGQPVGTSVGVFSTSDPDVGDSFGYSLVAGAGSDDNGSFTISGNTLKTNEIFNMATKSSYSIRVRTTDGGALSFEKAFTISVTKPNTPPVAADQSVSTSEDTPKQITLSASDAEDDPLAFSFASGPSDGGLGPISAADCSAVNVCTETVTYTPSADFNGADSFTFKANDGIADSNTATVSITVDAVNDAPVLDATKSPALSAVDEDAAAPVGAVGTLVSDLVDFAASAGGLDNVADVDAGALLGIALTGSDQADGAWFYSLNNGASWTPLGSVSVANARLLAANATNRVYFQPGANVSGMLANALTFRAWDRTNGSDDGLADTSTNGGASAFSSATDGASIVINPVNDAPTATNLSAAESYTEDTPLNLIDIVVSDVDSANVTATLTVSNPAIGSLSTGTSGAVTSTYSAGTGVWTASGALANVNTLLAGVVFTPAANISTNFTIATSVSDGALSATGSKAVTGVAVNDAPVLDASKSPVLEAENEDPGTPTGAVGTLVSSLVDFASPAGQLDNVSDVDAGALLGIAVTAADTANGSWSYSIDNGTTWQPLGAVTNTTARLLPADANGRLFFQPNANFNGNLATAITFRAWDRTSGANGALADASTNGGTSAFSTATDTASLVINAVNDAPVLDASKSPALSAENEDAGVAAGAVGTLVSSLVDFATPPGQLDNVTDVDAGALLGIAITAADTTNGSWFYSTNNGTTWTALGAMSATNSRLLAANANNRLYFQPSANFNGTISSAITFRVWDETSGADGGLANTSTNGGTTAFSAVTDTASLVINAVNDAPVVTNKTATAQANMKLSISGLLGGVTDADTGVNGCNPTFAIAGVGATTSPAGGTVTVTDAANGVVDFDPPAGVTGAVTFTYTVSDNGCPGTATSAPATVTVTVNGPVIWFVNANAVTNGTGTLTSPFNTLAAANAVDAANQGIFLYSSATSYTGALTLNTGEKLIGQGTTGTNFDSVFGISPPASTISRPTLGAGTATMTGTLELAGSTKLRGLALSTGASNGLVGSGGISGVDLDQVSVTTTTGTAVNLNNAAGTYIFSGVSTNGAANGILLDTLGVSNVTVGGGSIVNASTRGIDINSGTGNYSFANTITTTATGRSVEVTNHTGGTVAFNGALTDSGTGINLSTNTGGTINFTGGLTASTTGGANSAFAATGGGTVNVTGATNTLTATTTTGAALNVASTAIGSSGLTFKSIAANGAATGIVLNSTGSSGGLTVTGTGTAGTGGTIQNTTGHGINLANVGGSVSLSYINVTNPGLTAIQAAPVGWVFATNPSGLGVNNFTLDHSNLSDNAGSNTSDDGLRLENASGTTSLTNNSITGSRHQGITVDNFNTNMASLALSNTTVSGTPGGDGVLIQMRGTSTLTTGTIGGATPGLGNTFSNNSATGLQVNNADTGNIAALTLQNNTVSGNNAGMDLDLSQSSSMTVTVQNNTYNSQHSTALNLVQSTSSTAGALTASLKNNVIGTAGVLDSGSAIGSGIRVANGGVTISLNVDSNVIREVPNGRGIDIEPQAYNVNANVKAKITNNTIVKPTGTNQSIGCGANVPCPSASIFVLSDSNLLGGFEHECLVVTGNSAYDPTSWPAGGEGAFYFARRTSASNTINLEGTQANVTAQILATNTVTNLAAAGVVDENTSGPVAIVPAGTCGTFPP